jgi:hypothetical protein
MTQTHVWGVSASTGVVQIFATTVWGQGPKTTRARGCDEKSVAGAMGEPQIRDHYRLCAWPTPTAYVIETCR